MLPLEKSQALLVMLQMDLGTRRPARVARTAAEGGNRGPEFLLPDPHKEIVFS